MKKILNLLIVFILIFSTSSAFANNNEPQTKSLKSQQIMELEKQGCCSWHGGVCGCSGGRVRCCDGTLSPSCRCYYSGNQYILYNYIDMLTDVLLLDFWDLCQVG